MSGYTRVTLGEHERKRLYREQLREAKRCMREAESALDGGGPFDVLVEVGEALDVLGALLMNLDHEILDNGIDAVEALRGGWPGESVAEGLAGWVERLRPLCQIGAH